MNHMQYRVIKAHLNKISELEQEAGLKDVALKWLAPAAIALQTAFSALPAEAAKLDSVQLVQKIQGQKAGEAVRTIFQAGEDLVKAYKAEVDAIDHQLVYLDEHKGQRTDLGEARKRLNELRASMDAAKVKLEEAAIQSREDKAVAEDNQEMENLRRKLQLALKETLKSLDRLDKFFDVQEGRLSPEIRHENAATFPGVKRYLRDQVEEYRPSSGLDRK